MAERTLPTAGVSPCDFYGELITRPLGYFEATSEADDQELIKSYFTTSGKNAYGLWMQVEKTSATTGAPRVLTLRAVLSHTSGYAPQGANAVDARATLETGNTGISGEMHAQESQCRVDAETRSVQGTYSAHKFTNQFGANNTMPASSTFFARFYDAGTVKTPLMFDFTGLTAGASNCVVANSAALQAAEYFLRVKSPDGGTGYIPILSALG